MARSTTVRVVCPGLTLFQSVSLIASLGVRAQHREDLAHADQVKMRDTRMSPSCAIGCSRPYWSGLNATVLSMWLELDLKDVGIFVSSFEYPQEITGFGPIISLWEVTEALSGSITSLRLLPAIVSGVFASLVAGLVSSNMRIA